jgi:hypothetical protein
MTSRVINFNNASNEIPSFERAIKLAVENLLWIQGYLINDDPNLGSFRDIFVKDCGRLIAILNDLNQPGPPPPLSPNVARLRVKLRIAP